MKECQSNIFRERETELQPSFCEVAEGGALVVWATVGSLWELGSVKILQQKTHAQNALQQEKDKRSEQGLFTSSERGGKIPG